MATTDSTASFIFVAPDGQKFREGEILVEWFEDRDGVGAPEPMLDKVGTLEEVQNHYESQLTFQEKEEALTNFAKAQVLLRVNKLDEGMKLLSDSMKAIFGEQHD